MEAAKLIQDSSAQQTSMDGLRIDYPDHWDLIRASNNEAVIVMRFEAQSEILITQFQSKFETALTIAAEKLNHGKFNSKNDC